MNTHTQIMLLPNRQKLIYQLHEIDRRRLYLTWLKDSQGTDSQCNEQDPQQQDRAGAQGRGGAVFPVAVGPVRAVTVVVEAAFQLHLTVAHVRLVTERLVSAWLHHRVCGEQNTDLKKHITYNNIPSVRELLEDTSDNPVGLLLVECVCNSPGTVLCNRADWG